MFATVLAMAAATTPHAGLNRVTTGLRVEAIVVRPLAMPNIRRSRQSLIIDNPGAIAISIDDETPSSASRTIPLSFRTTAIRQITLIF